MSKPRIWTRRQFLTRALAAAGALAAPDLWKQRMAFGQEFNPDARVHHLILMYAGGGLRCSSAWNAGTSMMLNPYGVYPDSGGWRVSRVFDAERLALPSFGEELMSGVELSNVYSILGNVDHTPGTPRGDGGHGTAYLRMGTGSPTGRVGILTMINREIGLPMGVPSFIVGGESRFFGLATGDMTSQRPVFLNGADDFQRLSSSVGSDGVSWEADLEHWLDERAVRGCHDFHTTLLEASQLARDQAKAFLDEFDDDALDINGTPTGVLGELNNAELTEIFPDDGYWCRQSALAVRLIQKGSPAVCIGRGGYDTHSGEAAPFDELMDSYALALSGLHFALTRLEHPLGGTFWDHTLIMGCSEFGRDNTSEVSGFNRGNGSDHQGTNACRYQTFPIGGGAVRPGTTFNDVNGNTWEPIDNNIVSSRQVLATILDAMGIPPAFYELGEENLLDIFV